MARLDRAYGPQLLLEETWGALQIFECWGGHDLSSEFKSIPLAAEWKIDHIRAEDEDGRRKIRSGLL